MMLIVEAEERERRRRRRRWREREVVEFCKTGSFGKGNFGIMK